MFYFEDALNLLNISDMLIWHVTCVTPELGECQVCSVGDNLGPAFPGYPVIPNHTPSATGPHAERTGWSMRQCVNVPRKTPMEGPWPANMKVTWRAVFHQILELLSCSIRNRSWPVQWISAWKGYISSLPLVSFGCWKTEGPKSRPQIWRCDLDGDWNCAKAFCLTLENAWSRWLVDSNLF